MLELLACVFLGCFLGFISGLVPGFHANNVALIALWASAAIEFDPLMVSTVLISAGVAHAFVDFIPSIFLGAPSEDTALAISPGHRMLVSGRGFEALFLSVAGGLFGIIAVLLFFVVLEKFAGPAYSLLHGHLGLLLAFVSVMMISVERRKAVALGIFLLSGIYGIVSLNSPINGKFVLLPILSGLFGGSTLLLSCKDAPKIPVQRTKVSVSLKDALQGGTVGFLGGVVAGFLPGVGTSQSAILVQRLSGIRGSRKFIMVLGAIGAADVILAVLALLFIGRARSGIAAAVETALTELSIAEVRLFLGVGLVAAGISAFVALRAGKLFAKKTESWDTQKASLAIFAFLFSLCAMFTGTLGVVVFLTGCAIGVLPHILGTKKSLLLACLLLQTMLYFTGLDCAVLGLLGI